jgi:hypothetical protein
MTIAEIIATLREGLASSEATVTYEGRSITYKDNKSIKDAIAYFEALLDAASGGGRTQSLAVFDRS